MGREGPVRTAQRSGYSSGGLRFLSSPSSLSTQDCCLPEIMPRGEERSGEGPMEGGRKDGVGWGGRENWCLV